MCLQSGSVCNKAIKRAKLKVEAEQELFNMATLRRGQRDPGNTPKSVFGSEVRLMIK